MNTTPHQTPSPTSSPSDAEREYINSEAGTLPTGPGLERMRQLMALDSADLRAALASIPSTPVHEPATIPSDSLVEATVDTKIVARGSELTLGALRSFTHATSALPADTPVDAIVLGPGAGGFELVARFDPADAGALWPAERRQLDTAVSRIGSRTTPRSWK